MARSMTNRSDVVGGTKRRVVKANPGNVITGVAGMGINAIIKAAKSEADLAKFGLKVISAPAKIASKVVKPADKPRKK